MWIQDGLVIHDKHVLMVPVGKFQACHPSSVRHPAHGRGVPMVEITRERNPSRFRCVAEEKYMMQVPLRRMERRGNPCGEFRKHNVISFQEFKPFNYSECAPAAIVPEKMKKSFGNKIPRRMVLLYEGMDKKYRRWTNAND
jgi:hypothetical protein